MLVDKYSKKFNLPYELRAKKGNISGILFSVSRLIMRRARPHFLPRSNLQRNNNLDVAKVFTTIYSIMFAGMTVGNTHFVPNVSTTKNSAADMFDILHAEDEDRLSPHLKP